MDQRTSLIQAWATKEAAASEELRERTQAAVWALWSRFRRWYSPADVKAVAAQAALLAEQGRIAAGNLGLAYMQEVTAVVGIEPPTVRRLDLPAARRGADLTQVYSRPGDAYRYAYGTTEDDVAATQAAHDRLDQLVESDLLVARRDGELQGMGFDDGIPGTVIIGYRRIIHPERSRGGVCGLCLAASDRIYTMRDLLPIHERCKCTTAPISEDYDPGESNDLDLEAIYKAAGGSTAGKNLKKTRYQVNDHGELGPVLTREGDRFQGKGDAPAGDPADRARRELEVLEPVLASLERRAAAGEDVAGPLKWQRDRVAKLRAIVGA